MELFYIILLNTTRTFLPYSAILGSANGGCGGSTPSCLHKFKESNATDVFDTLPPAKVITAIPVFVAFLPVASHKLSLMCASKRPFYCHLIIASANFIYCQLEIRKGFTQEVIPCFCFAVTIFEGKISSITDKFPLFQPSSTSRLVISTLAAVKGVYWK